MFEFHGLSDPMKVGVHIGPYGYVEPAQDITPREAVQLCMLLACASCGAHVDYEAFVKEHRLERHFKNG